MKRIDRKMPSTQTGTTLVVSLVLILLASLLGLFAMNVGMFAQRSSAADMRARVIHETLEAALSQGVEYIKNNKKTVIDSTNTALWQRCGATDTTFPCGTVPQCASNSVSSSGCTDPALGRRGNMYYYVTAAGAGYDVDGDGTVKDSSFDLRSLPVAVGQRIATTNGFSVNYGVGVVMCMIKKPQTASDPTECTTDTTKKQGTYLFTLTAVGSIAGEAATTTLTTTFGDMPLVPGAANAPTLVASGSADLTGNGTIVTDPNGGGEGLPVSVWTRGPTTKTGTVNTCYMEDYIRGVGSVNKNSSYSYALNSDGTTSTVVNCSGSGSSCNCSTNLSYQSSGNTQQAGIDILSNDNSANPIIGTTACNSGAAGTCKSNYDVEPNEFPCDLFQFVFGVQAWEDDSGTSGVGTENCTHDCFCETKKTTSYKTADGVTRTMGVDEAYLYAKAALILPSSAHTAWVTSSQLVADCATLISKTSSATATGGIVWVQTGDCLAAIGSGNKMGWPDKPVALVQDTSGDLLGGTFYGLVFIRDPNSSMNVSTGGVGTFTAHSNGTVYGSVVVQGTAAKLNGSSAIIYNGTVLGAFATESGGTSDSPVPGSWTDRYAY